MRFVFPILSDPYLPSSIRHSNKFDRLGLIELTSSLWKFCNLSEMKDFQASDKVWKVKV